MRITELLEDAMMGKIEQSGQIVRILKKQHSVPFSDEKNWLLIDTDPAKGNKGLGIKWIPANTRFEWVRPYKDSVAEGVAENNTAAGITKAFNNLGDPVFANLQRVALLAMQGRQSEAAGRLQTVIKDADPAVQKKITDAVNNIKPVTINGRVADSSTLDKSKQHNDWIINTFIPWVQSLLGQQGVAENFADGWNPGRRGLAKHLMRESASEREIAQAQYMQGECAVLALVIHKINPQRFPLGFVYEFFDSVPDMYLEPDEFDELDHARQQDIQYNHENWTLTHAYVFDVKTREYIDAEGRHKQLPTIGRGFNATRHNKFPAELQDLVNVSHYMEWDEAQEKWIVLSGWDALDKAYTHEGKQRAREYAIKYLGIDRPAQDVAENFADGRHPEDKGDAKRYGVNTKASVSSLRKTAKQGGRKGQLAHWMANMKAGKAKKK